MRLVTRLALTAVLLTALVLPALAGGTPVDLPSGETVVLMHPGVDGVRAPRAVRSRMVAPRYPSNADRFPGGSRVTVAAMILTDGSLGQLEVLGASHPNLGYEEAAKDAVGRWTFKPGRLDGQPVTSYQIYTIEFPDRLTALDQGSSMGPEKLFDPANTFFMSTGGAGGIAGSSSGNASTLTFGNGSRGSVASRPPYQTGQLTDRSNSGQFVGTTDWAARNGR